MPNPHRYRYTKPTPAWVVIGVLSSFLILILQVTLWVSDQQEASFIVALTYNIALFMAAAFFLVAQKLPFLDVEIDLRSVVTGRGRRDVMVEVERPPPPYVAGDHGAGDQGDQAGRGSVESEDAVRAGSRGTGDFAVRTGSGGVGGLGGIAELGGTGDLHDAVRTWSRGVGAPDEAHVARGRTTGRGVAVAERIQAPRELGNA